MNYQDVLSQVVCSVQKSGELLIAEWNRIGGVRGNKDKAEIDVEIESLLRRDLLSIINCDFWGEETGHSLSGHDYCWVVDPNDGTSEFLKGIKGSSISVGLLRASKPILGVVYAPLLENLPPDCIAWAEGMSSVQRNGQPVSTRVESRRWHDCNVMVSLAALSKMKVNSELCYPGKVIAMPSIAYRLARVAAGDGVAGVSLVPVSAHDVVAGHALLKGAGGVLLDQDAIEITYSSESKMRAVSRRCFGGSISVCRELIRRDWDRVFQ